MFVTSRQEFRQSFLAEGIAWLSVVFVCLFVLSVAGSSAYARDLATISKGMESYLRTTAFTISGVAAALAAILWGTNMQRLAIGAATSAGLSLAVASLWPTLVSMVGTVTGVAVR